MRPFETRGRRNYDKSSFFIGDSSLDIQNRVLVFHGGFSFSAIRTDPIRSQMSISSKTSSIRPSTDLTSLLERCLGNVALVEKLNKAFLGSLPSEKIALRDAVANGDLNLIARIAHKLRGTASNMCALPLSDAASNVEQAARSNQIELVAQPWLELNHQIENVMNALSAMESSPL